MVNENRAEIQNTQPRDVAILARNFGEIVQRIVIERPERPAFEPFGRPGGEFFAARAPPNLSLCTPPRILHTETPGPSTFSPGATTGYYDTPNANEHYTH